MLHHMQNNEIMDVDKSHGARGLVWLRKLQEDITHVSTELSFIITIMICFKTFHSQT